MFQKIHCTNLVVIFRNNNNSITLPHLKIESMTLKRWVAIVLIVFGGIVLPSCAKKEPSVIKVFVRSSDYVLKSDVLVRIVSEVDKGTPEYYDEKRTDESGVSTFSLMALFDQYDKKEDHIAYFTVYAKDTLGSYTVAKIRAKANLTATETIFLNE